MVGRHPGERSIDPGELLRSALEKIVFFECRLAQLEGELAAARQVAERARADAAEARTLEAEACRALAAEREARAGLALREADATERVRLLEAERERLLAGLVERSRLHGAPSGDGTPGPEEGAADLASFMAELRAELETLRAWKAAHQGGLAPDAAAPGAAAPDHATPQAKAKPPAHATVDALAAGFSSEGRTGLAGADAARLKTFLTTHADQVLWERAMADLQAPLPATRLQAIRHLEALGARASAPLLAAALGREPEAPVKVELLRAMARFAEPFGAGLALGELEDPRAEVRAAALEALAALAEGEAGPHLLRALGDRSPVVRRRAAVLLGTSRDAAVEEALLAALRDQDHGVAKTAAAALAGREGEAVRRGLSRFETQRRVHQRLRAAQVAEATAGAPVPAAVRIASRLAAAEVAAGPAPAPAFAPAPANVVRAAPPRPVAAPARFGRTGTAVAVLEAATTALAAGPAPRPAASSGQALEEAVTLEVRGALRGLTTEELVRATRAPASSVEGALEVLAARGALELRGVRWWMA